jgi:hypothetical protein
MGKFIRDAAQSKKERATPSRYKKVLIDEDINVG